MGLPSDLALNPTSATIESINTTTSSVTAMNMKRCCSAIGFALDPIRCVLSEKENMDVVNENGSS